MNKQNKIDAIIFDIDGTLIDVRPSYIKTAEVTINNYLKNTAVNQDDILFINNLIGFNNLWEVSYALIFLIKNEVPKSRWQKCARKVLPINYQDKIFRYIYNLFQNIYLGSSLFEIFENKKAIFNYEPGLITMEKAFINKKIVSDLGQKYKLGVATGRPFMEAVLGLNQQNLSGRNFFNTKYLVGLEDTSKPKPSFEPLIKVREKLNAQNPIYVGDSLNDLEAARRANIPCLYLRSSMQNNQINSVLKSLI